jgi:hypothetical protein
MPGRPTRAPATKAATNSTGAIGPSDASQRSIARADNPPVAVM